MSHLVTLIDRAARHAGIDGYHGLVQGWRGKSQERYTRRYLTIWLLRQTCEGVPIAPSFVEIADAVGVKSHSTIVEIHKRAAKLLANAPPHQWLDRWPMVATGRIEPFPPTWDQLRAWLKIELVQSGGNRRTKR